MTASEKKQLMANACKVRMGVIESTYGAKSGHPGGSLSASDLFTYLYFREMKVDPADPKWEERDRFVLSKGHTAPGLYAALALKGFFPWEELKTLRHIGSRLQGHPPTNETPGVDMSTGSLGQPYFLRRCTRRQYFPRRQGTFYQPARDQQINQQAGRKPRHSTFYPQFPRR